MMFGVYVGCRCPASAPRFVVNKNILKERRRCANYTGWQIIAFGVLAFWGHIGKSKEKLNEHDLFSP